MVASLSTAAIANDREFARDIDKHVECLAKNMYFESRNQPFRGMLAVGQVTMNRVSDDRFPDTICEVVEQGPTSKWWRSKGKIVPLRNRCQFSWYCDGKSDNIPSQDRDLYSIIRAMAFKIATASWKDITYGSTHYHADYVHPEWASSKTQTITVANHIFYRWERK